MIRCFTSSFWSDRDWRSYHVLIWHYSSCYMLTDCVFQILQLPMWQMNPPNQSKKHVSVFYGIGFNQSRMWTVVSRSSVFCVWPVVQPPSSYVRFVALCLSLIYIHPLLLSLPPCPYWIFQWINVSVFRMKLGCYGTNKSFLVELDRIENTSFLY